MWLGSFTAVRKSRCPALASTSAISRAWNLNDFKATVRIECQALLLDSNRLQAVVVAEPSQ